MARAFSERQNRASIPLVRLVKLADCPLDVRAEGRSAHSILARPAPAVSRGENDCALNLNVDGVDPSNRFFHSLTPFVVPMLRHHESSDVGKQYLSLTTINDGLGAAA